MRFIDRTRLSPPKLLFDTRTEEARTEVEAFISQTSSKGGTRRTPQSDWLDGDDRFRSDMAHEFGYCCAYCESETLNQPDGLDGVVGRHRPPMLAEDERGNTELLAYCWLIYDWENLLWLCPSCARVKGNRFFIRGERGGPFMPVGELRAREQERMLDPCFHDPAEHLRFHADGWVTPLSPQGEATIDVLALNNPDLANNRRDAIRNFALALQEGGVRADGGVIRPLTSGDGAPYAGAVTSVILRIVEEMAAGVTNAESLAAYLNRFDEKDRVRFSGDLLARIDDAASTASDDDGFELASSPAPSAKQPEPKPPSRIPDIRRLPNALHPITQVRISNFKVLRDIVFDLPERLADVDQSPCMLLLGENATGKSSVLEAMALAVIGAPEAAELDAAIDTEDLSPAELIHRPDPYRWADTAPSMSIRLFFLDSTVPAELTAKAGDALFSGSDHCSKVVLAYGPRRYFTKRKTRRLRAPAHRVRSLFDPMDMIANPILWLSSLKGKDWEAAARALREVLMLADTDDFERDDDPDTPGQIYVRQDGRRVAMKDMSVGYKSVIAMVCDIIREMLYHYDNLEFASAVVFIDEIETHLHPRWKMRIMTLLRRAFPKVQFIVTTHDPLCLSGMYDGEVFVLQRSPEDNVERVTDLPSIRGMRAEQILTSEFFGLGSTDPETDARLARYNLLAARIEDLSEDERAEIQRLRMALDDGMVLGSTMREQAYAEALKKQVSQRDVAPTRAASPRRAELRQTFSALFEEDQA